MGTSASNHDHDHPKLAAAKPDPAFSLLRASVPARLGVVSILSAVLWLAILWALA
jgi:hypothetical protein